MNGFVHNSKIRGIFSNISKTIILVWKAQPGFTILVAVLSIVQGCLPVIQLWISKVIIDSLIVMVQEGSQDVYASLGYLLTLVGIQGGVLFLGSVMTMTQGTIHALLGELLSNQISIQVLNKSNGLEVAFFENEQFHDKLQNAYQEANNRPVQIVSQIFSLGQMIVTLSSMIILLSRLHWALLPLIVLTSLPMLVIQSRYGDQKYWMLRQRTPLLRKQRYYGMLLTSERFIKEVRVFQLEDYFINSYRVLFTRFFDESRKLVLNRDLKSMVASLSSTLGWLFSVGYVVLQATRQIITVGDFTLYTQAISTTQRQFQSLFSGLSSLYSNILFMQNLFEFLSLPARDLSSGKEWTDPIEKIEFRNVSFHYPGTNHVVLHNINFKVQRGGSIALVGKNGAGKTTIVKLLCRLYEPSSGEIRINGKDIALYSPRSVQERLATLFQDYGGYYLTAKENIGIGRTSSLNDMPSIETAAHKSGADVFINRLPDKYETNLGRMFEGGVDLSGGEWQKIALARAFLRKGDVLILDEPTASLDAEAEADIFENIVQDNSNRITLLISHRFSTVRKADQILVIDDGKCIEAGSHKELLIGNKQYAHLFKLQARGYNTATISSENMRQENDND